MYSNDYLPGRPAGPTRPHEDLLAPEKDPNEVPLSEAERNKLRALAKEFGFGGETLVNQYQVGERKNWTLNCVFQVARRTEGFRKLYCGAISANTSEKMLQAIAQNIIVLLVLCFSLSFTGLLHGVWRGEECFCDTR